MITEPNAGEPTRKPRGPNKPKDAAPGLTLAPEFKIESNIPLPNGGTLRGTKYPFGLMKKGDSFLVATPDDGKEKDKKVASISNSVSTFRKADANKRTKFTVRKVDGGVRCWRVE